MKNQDTFIIKYFTYSHSSEIFFLLIVVKGEQLFISLFAGLAGPTLTVRIFSNLLADLGIFSRWSRFDVSFDRFFEHNPSTLSTRNIICNRIETPTDALENFFNKLHNIGCVILNNSISNMLIPKSFCCFSISTLASSALRSPFLSTTTVGKSSSLSSKSSSVAADNCCRWENKDKQILVTQEHELN